MIEHVCFVNEYICAGGGEALVFRHEIKANAGKNMTNVGDGFGGIGDIFVEACDLGRLPGNFPAVTEKQRRRF